MKWAAIRKMVKRERIDILCLQETKKEQVDKVVCQALWGDADVSWELQPACNSAGGILCLWSQKTFRLERKHIGCNFIYLEGVCVSFHEFEQVCMLDKEITRMRTCN